MLAFGATRVMARGDDLGTLVGFYIVASMFLAPVGRFVELADERQALETDMQRLDDITDTPEDPGLARPGTAPESIATLDGRLRLAGQVELRDVTSATTGAGHPSSRTSA